MLFSIVVVAFYLLLGMDATLCETISGCVTAGKVTGLIFPRFMVTKTGNDWGKQVIG